MRSESRHLSKQSMSDFFMRSLHMWKNQLIDTKKLNGSVLLVLHVMYNLKVR